MRSVVAVLAFMVSVTHATAQDARPTVTIRIEVQSGPLAVAGATVTLGKVSVQTDESGAVRIAANPGRAEVTVAKEGFLFTTVAIVVEASEGQEFVIEITPMPRVEEEVTVSATRIDARLQDLPTRVEVLDRDEIEEKILMTPGDIVMMLNEMGGLRVQATSPSLGAASVRIQGMKGRYTRFLADGLPLFGQQVGGLGLLQIPPMDLGQVEVIKGVASALYGSGAMGGVVNLISRRPGDKAGYEFLVNQSTRGASDAVSFIAGPLSENWRASLLGGAHLQLRNDVDHDGWADLAGYTRGVLRPRFFWDGGNGRTGFLTGGITIENRKGGTVPGVLLQAAGAPYVEALETRRYDLGGSSEITMNGRYVLAFRGAFAWQEREHQFGPVQERDGHTTVFGEGSIRSASGRHTWVAGLGLDVDAYDPHDVPQFEYEYVIPGLFAQDDIVINPWLSVSASGRLDFHSEYGAFFSPRVSALFRGRGWTSRASAGQGFFGPTPLTEETEAAGLSRLQIPQTLRAERGRSVSFDLTRTTGTGSYTVTLFGSQVRDPLHVERDSAYELINLTRPTVNAGVELLATARPAPFSLTATYSYVYSREAEPTGQRIDTALTPRHSFGIVGMWEDEQVGRIGIECYYTGRQRLEVNPYRSRSEPYVIIGMLVERRFGRVRLFLNGENLTNVKQTNWNPLLRLGQGADGRWTVDAWAPLEGRVVNGGVRLIF